MGHGRNDSHNAGDTGPDVGERQTVSYNRLVGGLAITSDAACSTPALILGHDTSAHVEELVAFPVGARIWAYGYILE